MLIKYKVDDFNDLDDPDDFLGIEGDLNANSIDDLSFLAEKMAKDYYNNHDGWEEFSFPVVIHILDGSNNIIGSFHVELEYEPEFSARKIEVC